ncbi:ABC transporter substrate-binding protein [bacterium]|nr:ABC transporter substrate-binding protein [bacterium]
MKGKPVRGKWARAAVALLGLAAGLSACGGWKGADAEGPQAGRTFRVGVAPWILDKPHVKNIESFLAALASAGYRSDANLQVKIVDAVGSASTQSGIIRDFSAWPADLVYVLTAEGARIAQEEAPGVPLIFSDVAYPLEHGLVERMEFSANQSVGIQTYVPIEEQMALVMRLLPKEINKIALCLRTGDPDAKLLLEEMRKVLSLQGAHVLPVESPDAAGLARALSDPQLSGVDAFYLTCDSIIQGSGADAVIDFAARRGIPVLSCASAAVEKGALAGVTVDPEVAGRLAGQQASQILGGRTPTSLQSQAAAPPRVVVNRSAARALGVRIPESFLGESVQVYE